MIKTAILAAAAAVGAVTVIPLPPPPIYSSEFQCAYPIQGAFNMVPSPANIWTMRISEGIPLGGTEGPEIVVDIDGDGVRDQDEEGVRVAITDIQFPLGISERIYIASGDRLLWRLGVGISDTNGSYHFSTPLIARAGEPLRVVRLTGNSSPYLAEIIVHGRVLNL